MSFFLFQLLVAPSLALIEAKLMKVRLPLGLQVKGVLLPPLLAALDCVMSQAILVLLAFVIHSLARSLAH